ncbi:protein EMBRYONIC FLOWER 1 isoform X2 [Daucus carota subsp. sativus]|uniref:protein EMBRYONIC FLOWER 1 isoform X2 n=1 Tax=Daucus carota subsp. sativus TaxID=79200 RepID=UPI0030827B75
MEKNSIADGKNNHPGSIVTHGSRSAASHVKIDSISIELGKAMDKKVTERCHHFSIRRYVAEMREKDIRKCAPFGHDDDDETKLRGQLVPLNVPEFRWWQCESCVQNISVASALESQNIAEKASGSLIRGHGNSVKDVSSLAIGKQTSCLGTCPPCQIPERHTDGTEPGGDVVASDVLAIDYPSQKSSSSGDMCPAERTDALNNGKSTLVVANEVTNKDGDMDISRSAKEAGPVEQPSIELKTKQVVSKTTASCPRRRKKVRLIAELLNGNVEERSEQRISNKAIPKEVAPPASKKAIPKEVAPPAFKKAIPKEVAPPASKKAIPKEVAPPASKKAIPKEVAPPASKKAIPKEVAPPASKKAIPKEVAPPAWTSGQRKRKITQEPSRGTKPPSREAKKARKYTGDAKTTIATIHISDSDSEEDGASAGSGYRNHMPLQQTENRPSSSKLNSCKSMPREDFKDDIGLELSLNSYMDVDKIHTTAPQQKTVLSNDLWRTEGNCIGQLSAPNLSLNEEVNMTGKNAYSSDMMHEGENSLSLHKKLDLSLGCKNKKTNVPERFSEVSRRKTAQGSKKVLEQGNNDDVPMDIVELMAKHQYERGLFKNERNSFLAKRFDERNNAVMGFSAGHGIEVRSMQKEHNKWNPVLSQNKNNQLVAGNGDGSHVFKKLGTQNSASRTLIGNDTRTRLWNGDKLVHRPSLTDPEVFDTYNKAHDGPQPKGMKGKNGASGSSGLVNSKPHFPERMASQLSHRPTSVPSLDFRKGKRIWDLDLNRADPDDSDLGVLLPCPFVGNNKANQKEMESAPSYSNEAKTAMQLLSLMDAGMQSRSPFSVDRKKVTDQPLIPFNNHRDLSMDQRANLIEKPFFPQNQLLKVYSGSETAAFKSSPGAGPSLSTTGKNPLQDKQIGILGASAEFAFPIQPNALKVTENQKNMRSCHIHGAIVSLKDISMEEVCIVSKNPAEFTVPEPGNFYMIDSEDLKFSKDFSSRYRGFDGQRRL